MVTNNQVDRKIDKAFRARGVLPGDAEYEAEGIFEKVTMPRVTYGMTGQRDGVPLEGEYLSLGGNDPQRMSDGFPETVVFYEVMYLDAERVKLDLAFKAVAPMLWLRSGANGPVITHRSTHGFSVTKQYGVLHDVDAWRAFVNELPETATMAFIVTDSPSAYSTVAGALPTGVEKVRLYEKYISTFEINTAEGRDR
jgi:adenine-specific DNA-methyltransferase